MKMEIGFKFFWTLVLIIVFVFSINWIWTNQIDVKKTILGFLKKGVERPVDWIATRDENTIYQNGEIVGNVTAKVDETEDKLIFHEICDTSNLNKELPFEYRREKLLIVKIGSFIAQKIIVGSEIRYSVIGNVVCEKVK